MFDVVSRKRANKSAHHRRRNQKQTRRQTAPVDLAYEAHQRQKYKTLVSLNSQTLRKVITVLQGRRAGSCKNKHFLIEPVGMLVQDIAIGSGGLWFRFPGRSNWTQCRQRPATAATFFRSCVAQTLNRGDGSHHSLHASA